MPQRPIEKNGVKKLLIYVGVRCKDHPTGRVQLSRTYDNLEKNSVKANQLERELLREAEREKAQRENDGTCWEVLITLYDKYARDRIARNDWCQSRQTYDEAMRSLHKWTSHWYRMPAARITAADVTKLFHHMKEQKMSDSVMGKIRGDIRKIFEFGMLFDHVRGIRHSPTTGVTVKSRRRMRSEVLCEAEIKKLLSYARQYEPTWYYVWAVAVYTGCRNGELFALKWDDVDFRERMITVQRSFNKKLGEKGTKTEDWRKVSICEPLWKIIGELKELHDHDVSRGACSNPGYVLPRPGTWKNGEQARKLREFCTEIGITPICFHTLRACFATELLKRGVDVPSVMRVGGWKSLKTMMHYVRLSGVDVRGVTDPLDYRTEAPEETNKVLMDAVGERFNAEENHGAKIIPLGSRKHPRLMGSR